MEAKDKVRFNRGTKNDPMWTRAVVLSVDEKNRRVLLEWCAHKFYERIEDVRPGWE